MEKELKTYESYNNRKDNAKYRKMTADREIIAQFNVKKHNRSDVTDTARIDDDNDNNKTYAPSE